MAGADRAALTDVIAHRGTAGFEFYQLVELISRLEGVDQERALDFLPTAERIRYRASASLGFPAREVQTLQPDAQGRHQLEVAFLGLHGSQSPMPGYYLDELAWEYAQREQTLGHFLDFFHHRLLTLLHRAWRKYRYHVRFQHQGEDGFSQLMFALVGLANPVVRQSLPVNRAKMLSYAGLLASPSRSPEVVSGLVAHCFDLPWVQVDAWQTRRVPVQPDQQNRLGQTNVSLGQTLVLGDKVGDCAGKFLLRLGRLSFAQFRRFLPDGEHFRPLVQFVAFMLRDQMAWDLRLELSRDEARAMQLGQMQSSCLGWSSFLGQPPAEPFVTICVQE